MVGSVLIDRMQAEGDFGLIEPVFFSTSNAGGKAPAQAKNETTLKDAFDIDALKKCDAVERRQIFGPAQGLCASGVVLGERKHLRLVGIVPMFDGL